MKWLIILDLFGEFMGKCIGGGGNEDVSNMDGDWIDYQSWLMVF
jgi:hypothetical protein